MEFQCLGTGSSGNSYLVKLGGCTILLDAGIAINKIVKACNLNDIAFAFVSHNHKDHSYSMDNLKKRNVFIVEGRNAYTFGKIANKGKLPKDLALYAFPVEHGDCKCGGLIIMGYNECILYVTDFTVCKYDLSIFRFTSVIVECNYIKDKAIHADNYLRTKENINRHLSLDGCDMFLSKLNLNLCKEIILTHFSESFSDPIYMGSYINNKYKIPVKCCRKFGGYDLYE